MKCMKCGNSTAVVDTRTEGLVMRRKRVCGTCLARMYTIEAPEETELGVKPKHKKDKSDSVATTTNKSDAN